MRLSTREDINATPDHIFDHLADFTVFRGEALRRGVSMRRTDALSEPAAGMSWQIDFDYRGKARQVMADVQRFDRPEALDYRGLSGSYEVLLELRLMALARARTRLIVGIEVKPRTLGARLVVQSARLGRAGLEKKLAERVRGFARRIERGPQD